MMRTMIAMVGDDDGVAGAGDVDDIYKDRVEDANDIDYESVDDILHCDAVYYIHADDAGDMDVDVDVDIRR